MAQILQTLDRGIRILKYLALFDGPKTVADISASLEIERTAVFRCLSTLASQDLVAQDRDSRWQVDARAALLAPQRVRVLAMQATPILQELANAVGCTACLTIAQGDLCIALKVCEPPGGNFHISYREGSTHPCDQGAAGLAIRANEAELPGERADLQQIRQQPYAYSVGELQPTAHGYAIAVPSATTRASVGLISLDALEDDDFLTHLSNAALDLGAAIREIH